MSRLLGDRSLRFVADNLAELAHYRALWNMARRYPRPLDAYARYLFGRGGYPVRVAVRTPLGIARPLLWSFHDMLTLNEIFCREDYRVARPPGLVVDIGSNIGLSALYFLTRGADVRVRLYEPVARNVERLRRNLEGFEERYELERVAVADFDGETQFSVDPFGRYGGIGLPGESTTVACRHIDAVLQDALATANEIDVLKIDVEGYEPALLRAARADLLARARLVYLEGALAELPAPPGFAASESCATVRLQRTISSQSAFSPTSSRQSSASSTRTG